MGINISISQKQTRQTTEKHFKRRYFSKNYLASALGVKKWKKVTFLEKSRKNSLFRESGQTPPQGGPPQMCLYRPLFNVGVDQMPTGGPGLLLGKVQNSDPSSPHKLEIGLFRVSRNFFFLRGACAPIFHFFQKNWPGSTCKTPEKQGKSP